MHVIVCGGRNFSDRDLVWSTLDELRITIPHDALIIVHGGARGADSLAREWCIERSVPFENVPADWRSHGKSAGPIRNQRMIDQFGPSLVVAFPGGSGTADMVRKAHRHGIKIQAVAKGIPDLTMLKF